MSDYADNLRKSMINKTRRFMRMVQELKEKDDAALREQVIRMAREAGLHSAVLLHIYGGREGAMTDGEIDELRRLERFAALVAAAEREACAKVCEEHWHIDGEHTAYEFARIIRARGEK
jgi:hypothetical protein